MLSNSARSESRGVKMVQKFGLMLIGAGLLASAHGEDAKVEYKPLAFGGFSEFGLMRSGQYGEFDFKNEWVDHFGAYVAQTVLPSENLAFDVGIGGVFEYQKRETIRSQWGGTQYKNFFIGPAVADIRYGAASRDGQGFGLQFGMFDYKYNHDASNLGEYLFRSGTYPGYVTSGGFWFLNNSGVQMQGLRAGYGAGALKSDFFLTTETSIPALYDLSGAAVVSYKIADGLLDLGAGLNYKHMIPVKPSRVSPHIAKNAYFEKGGVTYSGKDDLYFQSSNFYKKRAEQDPANAATYLARAAADSIKGANVRAWVLAPKDSGIALKYYTQQGLIAMARASLDLKKVFQSEAFGGEDLRLFAEMAILGIQNYPLYYEKITERMPMMVGLNLPCFKVLDLLSVQAEYYNSPHLNSYTDLVGTNSAVPTHVSSTDVARSDLEYNDITKHDNLSWSVLAKKSIGRGAYISGQVAHDHIRTVSIETWTAPEPTQVLGKPGDWYWMLQLGFGI
ncbi:MAG: hypothetical protein JWP91_671 [Fibrobacteres bacterium]|nr:hypothetical protein [Fibrobacterota bacterium]